MNVLEKNEVYGNGVVLFNVLISKHVDEKWQQALATTITFTHARFYTR